MRNGYNPARRNRNIGTSKQGHGKDNRLTIPSICRDERIWWEQLGKNYSLVRRTISGRDLVFIVETTKPGYFHSCTVEDICWLLSLVPLDDWESLELVVLRQSTRKQEIDKPTWGRMAYHADLGQPAKLTVASGPAIFLEAQKANKVIKWSASLDPDDQAELDRLKADGHTVTRQGSKFLVSGDREAVRATQLYRTFLHELGHWVDWLQKVVRPSQADPAADDKLTDKYFSRPKAEREMFAHNYATQIRTKLMANGQIPFATIADTEGVAPV